MKNNLARVLIFSVLIITGFSGPVWIFGIGLFGYIFLYSGLEVLILAAAIDAYFGYASDSWFMYTILTATGLLIVQWLKPYLSVYNQ